MFEKHVSQNLGITSIKPVTKYKTRKSQDRLFWKRIGFLCLQKWIKKIF